MTQTDFVFDRQESARRKERGMAVAADHASTLLAKAREIAVEIARKKGEVTSDDVSIELGRRGWPDCLGPAAGSIFKTKDWAFTGKFVNSTRITNHSRLLRVWKLK